MANKYNIPDWLEKKIRKRDKRCVYCGILMTKWVKGKYKTAATIEHFDDESVKNPTEENIAICCHSCNASRKGNLTKASTIDWFNSPHCKKKNINKKTVAKVVKRYIKLKRK